MKLSELDIFYEPTLKEVMETNDEYIIDPNDFDSKYWKTYHFYNLILPIQQLLDRYKHLSNASHKCPSIMKILLQEQLDYFLKHQR